jgi:hypothetical protein
VPNAAAPASEHQPGTEPTAPLHPNRYPTPAVEQRLLAATQISEQAKREEQRRITAQQEQQAEQWAIQGQWCKAQASAFKREQDTRRMEKLRKDPSANFRHIIEVYKYWPPDVKKGEHRNTYLTMLLANRPMYGDPDSDQNLAIKYAKEHWECYAQWPKDTELYTSLMKQRIAREKLDAARV